MARTWRLGTRGSELARTQSGLVARSLAEATGDPVELVIVRTRGDAITDRPLAQVGGKGLFTKELEEALLVGDVDLAVHSMKDMPTEAPAGLVIAGMPPREDPRDALVGSTLDGLAEGAVVGTGSARRAMQLAALRPDLQIRGIRGNVDTRIRRQVDGDYDAVVLAAAGIARLGRSDEIAERLAVDVMVPAVGQGVLAVQCREQDAALRGVLHDLSDPDVVDAVTLERAFLVALGGGCSVPVACHAVARGEVLSVHAFLGRADGAWVAETGTCRRAEAATVGRDLARRLKARLADEPARAADEGTAPRP
ncbi:MAG: hydroxymethylbilane synthase [Alphaproteobacteria bacterium]|nr:hydroxymethylbilane synthase [Alphaproteobacteria bacterium]